MEHTKNCRWEKTTEQECEWRKTHHYCPHPDHSCDCLPVLPKNEPTELAIEKVRKNRDDCDHIGFYVAFGYELLTMPNGDILASVAQNCMLCGKIFHKLIEVLKGPGSEVKKENSSILTGRN